MLSNSQPESQLKKLKIIIPTVFLLILIIARIILPNILLKKTNKYLSEFSPNYYLHMNDLDLNVLRMSYRFQDVIGKLKGSDQQFLKIEFVDISIAWREIFKGRILTNITTEKLDFLVTKDIKKLFPKKEQTYDIKKRLFPIKVERFDLSDASITFEDYKSLNDESRLKISNISGRINNINPTEKLPLTFFTLTGNILDRTSKFTCVGELNQLKNPLVWNLDAETKDIQLTALNPYLKKHLPLTFTKGTLDFYSEVKSENGKMVGYVKPFFKDINVIKNKEKFIIIKHFGIEIVSALANLLLRSKTKNVATILEFEYDKKFKIKIAKGISKGVKNSLNRQLRPGIEDRYNIN
jgi:hypothetical protein